jgi:hypothetical protein
VTAQPVQPVGTRRELIARVLEQHEPWAGGWHCYCQSKDGDGFTPQLPGSWEEHLAEVIDDALSTIPTT